MEQGNTRLVRRNVTERIPVLLLGVTIEVHCKVDGKPFHST